MSSEHIEKRLRNPHFQETAQMISEFLAPNERQEEYLRELYHAANIIAARMNAAPPNPDQRRVGGVLGVAKAGWTGSDAFMKVFEIGHITAGDPHSQSELEQNKLHKYFVYATAKILLLIQNYAVLHSGENGSLHPYGKENSQHPQQIVAEGNPIPRGAFRLQTKQDGELVIGFSGYFQEDDEAMVLASAVQANLISREESLQFAQQAGNTRYSEIIDKLLL